MRVAPTMASRGLGGWASECARRPLPAKPLNPSTPATVAAASAERTDGDRAPHRHGAHRAARYRVDLGSLGRI